MQGILARPEGETGGSGLAVACVGDTPFSKNARLHLVSAQLGKSLKGRAAPTWGRQRGHGHSGIPGIPRPGNAELRVRCFCPIRTGYWRSIVISPREAADRPTRWGPRTVVLVAQMEQRAVPVCSGWRIRFGGNAKLGGNAKQGIAGQDSPLLRNNREISQARL